MTPPSLIMCLTNKVAGRFSMINQLTACSQYEIDVFKWDSKQTGAWERKRESYKGGGRVKEKRGHIEKLYYDDSGSETKQREQLENGKKVKVRSFWITRRKKVLNSNRNQIDTVKQSSGEKEQIRGSELMQKGMPKGSRQKGTSYLTYLDYEQLTQLNFVKESHFQDLANKNDLSLSQSQVPSSSFLEATKHKSRNKRNLVYKTEVQNVTIISSEVGSLCQGIPNQQFQSESTKKCHSQDAPKNNEDNKTKKILEKGEMTLFYKCFQKKNPRWWKLLGIIHLDDEKIKDKKKDQNEQDLEDGVEDREGRVEEREGRVEERGSKAKEREGKAKEREGRFEKREGRIEEREGRVEEREGRVEEREDKGDGLNENEGAREMCRCKDLYCVLDKNLMTFKDVYKGKKQVMIDKQEWKF